MLKVKGQLFFKQTGFTLIEILVVMSVMAILGGLGFAGFVVYSRSQQIAQTSNNIKQLVSLARFNALSAVKSNRGVSGSTVTCQSALLESYSVNVLSSTQIDVKQDCVGMPSLEDKQIRLITLPQNLTLAVGGTCSHIKFAPLTAAATGANCTIIVSGYNTTKTITVDAVGNVSVP